MYITLQPLLTQEWYTLVSFTMMKETAVIEVSGCESLDILVIFYTTKLHHYWFEKTVKHRTVQQ